MQWWSYCPLIHSAHTAAEVVGELWAIRNFFRTLSTTGQKYSILEEFCQKIQYYSLNQLRDMKRYIWMVNNNWGWNGTLRARRKLLESLVLAVLEPIDQLPLLLGMLEEVFEEKKFKKVIFEPFLCIDFSKKMEQKIKFPWQNCLPFLLYSLVGDFFSSCSPLLLSGRWLERAFF